MYCGLSKSFLLIRCFNWCGLRTLLIYPFKSPIFQLSFLPKYLRLNLSMKWFDILNSSMFFPFFSYLNILQILTRVKSYFNSFQTKKPFYIPIELCCCVTATGITGTILLLFFRLAVFSTNCRLVIAFGLVPCNSDNHLLMGIIWST